MIIWLASYPRSGNTLTRTLINEVFQINTYSKYNDLDIGKNETVSKSVGHKIYSGTWADFYKNATDSPRLFLIKTHEPPIDDHPAIYIVRDGRAAIVSQKYYWARVIQNPQPLREFIEGKIWPGSWSEHLSAWQPVSRPCTLLVKYENINKIDTIRRIGNFLGHSKIKDWRNPFIYQHRIFPEFFRSGSNDKNIKELYGSNRYLFWQMHGTWMRRLSYDKNGGSLIGDRG